MSRIKFYCQVSGHDVGTVILLAPSPILSFDITIKCYCEVRREDVILLAPSPILSFDITIKCYCEVRPEDVGTGACNLVGPIPQIGSTNGKSAKM